MLDGPIRLVVRDGAVPVEAALPSWAAGAVAVAGVAAAAAVLGALGWVLWRLWMRRRRDPYEALLGRVSEELGVSGEERSRVLLASGGEARRAVGALLIAGGVRGAVRRARGVKPGARRRG